MIIKRSLDRLKVLKGFAREVFPERLFELRVIFISRMRSLLPGRRPSGLIIGSSNSANQASAWTHALNSQPSEGATSSDIWHGSISVRIADEKTPGWFASDIEISTAERAGLEFRRQLLRREFIPRGAVLIESLRPFFAFRKRKLGFASHFTLDDLILLRRMGKKIGVIFHGSDIRDPLAHAARNPYSPFRSEDPVIQTAVSELFKRSQINRELLPMLRRSQIPVFISTPDLFLEVPEATWLPAVVDCNIFREIARSSPLFTHEKLRVLYIPSRSWIKSAHLITPILEKLKAEGVIEWVNHVENGSVNHEEILGLIANADVVIDQFIGLFGVFALEAVASGRIVLTYVDPEYAAHPTPPHINVTPLTLEDEIRRVARDRERALIRTQKVVGIEGEARLCFTEVPLQRGIEAGLNFVQFYHDESFSARVIQQELVKGIKGIKSRRNHE